MCVRAERSVPAMRRLCVQIVRLVNINHLLVNRHVHYVRTIHIKHLPVNRCVWIVLLDISLRLVLLHAIHVQLVHSIHQTIADNALLVGMERIKI